MADLRWLLQRAGREQGAGRGSCNDGGIPVVISCERWALWAFTYTSACQPNAVSVVTGQTAPLPVVVNTNLLRGQCNREPSTTAQLADGPPAMVGWEGAGASGVGAVCDGWRGVRTAASQAVSSWRRAIGR